MLRKATALTKEQLDRAISRSLDPVFDRPPAAGTVEEAFDLLALLEAEHGNAASLTAGAALLASARPMMTRLAVGTGRVAGLARFTTFGRALTLGAAAAAGGARMAKGGRRALNELQVLATLIRARAQAVGVELTRDEVERIAIAYAIEPNPRRPVAPRDALVGAVVRRGAREAVRKDTSLRRIRARLERIDKLQARDFRELLGRPAGELAALPAG